MLVAFAVMHGRQGIDRQIGGQFTEHPPEHHVVDRRVRGQRQVGTVLFDGCGGKNQKRGLS